MTSPARTTRAQATVSLSGPIEARVLVGLASNPLGEYCALPLAGLTLSTTSNADFPGVPFDQGFNGPGALTGTYNITDDATSVGGADCATVNGVSKGAGQHLALQRNRGAAGLPRVHNRHPAEL